MVSWGFAKVRVFVHILLLKIWFRTICASQQIHARIIKGDSRIVAESGNAFALVIWIGSNPAEIIKITDYLRVSGTCESFYGGKGRKEIWLPLSNGYKGKALIRSISISLHLVLLFTLFLKLFSHLMTLVSAFSVCENSWITLLVCLFICFSPHRVIFVGE